MNMWRRCDGHVVVYRGNSQPTDEPLVTMTHTSSKMKTCVWGWMTEMCPCEQMHNGCEKTLSSPGVSSHQTTPQNPVIFFNACIQKWTFPVFIWNQAPLPEWEEKNLERQRTATGNWLFFYSPPPNLILRCVFIWWLHNALLRGVSLRVAVRVCKGRLKSRYEMGTDKCVKMVPHSWSNATSPPP